MKNPKNRRMFEIPLLKFRSLLQFRRWQWRRTRRKGSAGQFQSRLGATTFATKTRIFFVQVGFGFWDISKVHVKKFFHYIWGRVSDIQLRLKSMVLGYAIDASNTSSRALWNLFDTEFHIDSESGLKIDLWGCTSEHSLIKFWGFFEL